MEFINITYCAFEILAMQLIYNFFKLFIKEFINIPVFFHFAREENPIL